MFHGGRVQDMDPRDLERFRTSRRGGVRASRGAGRDLAMAPNLDQEIDLLLEKLNGIQAEVGVAKSSEGKEAEESGAAAAPRSGGDRFLDLKGMMISKLKEIKKVMQEQQEQRTSGGPSNPKQQIEQDSKVRKILRELNEDLQELEQLYNTEARKRRSKYTKEELQLREEVVRLLSQEIEQVRAAQRGGYIQGYDIKPAVVAMEDSELFRPKGEDSGMPRQQEKITAEQQMQLQQLRERDDKINEGVEQISKGVDVLKQLADQQNEEVKKHNVMLDNLGKRMDSVHEHVTNVNQKMKNTLDEVARSGDKFCMDAICILLLLGLIAVLYQLMTSEKKR